MKSATWIGIIGIALSLAFAGFGYWRLGNRIPDAEQARQDERLKQDTIHKLNVIIDSLTRIGSEQDVTIQKLNDRLYKLKQYKPTPKPREQITNTKQAKKILNL